MKYPKEIYLDGYTYVQMYEHDKDIYVSFGHPEKDLVWKWECDSCKHVNEKLIKAWPQKEIDFIALKNLDLNKEEK